MTRAVLVAVVLASACSSDVRMVLAPVEGCGSACGQSDMSCVRYLGIIAVGDDDEVTTACIRLEPGAMQTMCTHDLEDRIALALPENLSHVEVQGFASEAGCGRTTLFGGLADYDGGDEVRLAVSCNLDCSTYAPRDYDIHLVDLDALSAGAVCAPPADTLALDVAVGVTADYRRYTATPFFDVAFEPFDDVAMVAPPTFDGYVRLSGSGFDVGDAQGRCLSVDAFTGGEWNTSCIPAAPSRRPACGTAAAIEVGWVSRALSVRVERVLSALQRYTWYHVGVVWDADARKPVAGAVVEGLPEGVDVIYLDRVGDDMAARPGPTTGATGMFVVVGDMVGTVTVSAPGFASRAAPIAVVSHSPSGGIVVLDRQ